MKFCITEITEMQSCAFWDHEINNNETKTGVNKFDAWESTSNMEKRDHQNTKRKLHVHDNNKNKKNKWMKQYRCIGMQKAREIV